MVYGMELGLAKPSNEFLYGSRVKDWPARSMVTASLAMLRTYCLLFWDKNGLFGGNLAYMMLSTLRISVCQYSVG